MQLNIKDPKAYEMAQELARLTGESMTQAVVHALEERLRRKQDYAAVKPARKGIADALLAIADECSKLPVYDDRAPDEMLYDEHGLPKDREDR